MSYKEVTTKEYVIGFLDEKGPLTFRSLRTLILPEDTTSTPQTIDFNLGKALAELLAEGEIVRDKDNEHYDRPYKPEAA